MVGCQVPASSDQRAQRGEVDGLKGFSPPRTLCVVVNAQHAVEKEDVDLDTAISQPERVG